METAPNDSKIKKIRSMKKKKNVCNKCNYSFCKTLCCMKASQLCINKLCKTVICKKCWVDNMPFDSDCITETFCPNCKERQHIDVKNIIKNNDCLYFISDIKKRRLSPLYTSKDAGSYFSKLVNEQPGSYIEILRFIENGNIETVMKV